MHHHSKQKKSNKLFSFVVIILLLIIAIKSINGTPSSGEGPESPSADHDAVCFVVGNVANSPAPDFSNENFEETVKDVFTATPLDKKPNVCMYSATANPYSIEIASKYIEKKDHNQANQQGQIKRLIKGINEAAKTSPSEGGANYYEAIMRAASYLKGTGAESPLIIVYGSGLSDTGIVNFAFDGLLSKDEKYITGRISDSNIRQNDYGRTSLIWYGAGQTLTTNGQLPLSQSLINKTENIYIAALSYVGISMNPKSINISDTTTSVATDYWVNPTIVPGELKPGYKFSLNANIAKFDKNTANLINYDEVKDILSEFAKNFNDTTGVRIKLTGYQTKCGEGKGTQLSIDRATVIRNILSELHVDTSKITVNGVDGPQDDREEIPYCGDTGVAVEHRTVILEVLED